MNVCVLSELSTLFKAIVSRCSDLPGVHFTQLELENEGEHSLNAILTGWVVSACRCTFTKKPLTLELKAFRKHGNENKRENEHDELGLYML